MPKACASSSLATTLIKSWHILTIRLKYHYYSCYIIHLLVVSSLFSCVLPCVQHTPRKDVATIVKLTGKGHKWHLDDVFSFPFFCCTSCKHASKTNSGMGLMSKADHLTYTLYSFNLCKTSPYKQALYYSTVDDKMLKWHLELYQHGNLAGKATNQSTKDLGMQGAFLHS